MFNSFDILLYSFLPYNVIFIKNVNRKTSKYTHKQNKNELKLIIYYYICSSVYLKQYTNASNYKTQSMNK